MDEQEVKHCVLDMDKVRDDDDAAEWFHKWNGRLRNYLTRDGKDLLWTNQQAEESQRDERKAR